MDFLGIRASSKFIEQTASGELKPKETVRRIITATGVGGASGGVLARLPHDVFC